MGKTQPYEPGIGPQSSMTRACHCAATGGGTGISSSSPRSTWLEPGPNVPGGDSRRAIGADQHPGPDTRPVRQPGPGQPAVLADPPHRGPLPHRDARVGSGFAQRVVEVFPGHHGQQRRIGVAGELTPPVQGGGDVVDAVPRGHLHVPGRHRERGPDQAAAAGLVPGMLGPLDHDRPRPGSRRGQGGGQACRSRAHHRDVPFRQFRHPGRVTEGTRRAVIAQPGGGARAGRNFVAAAFAGDQDGPDDDMDRTASCPAPIRPRSPASGSRWTAGWIITAARC